MLISGSVNRTIANTGETEDIECNICDMASNLWELTTEYVTSPGYPCAVRGGVYSFSYYGAVGYPMFRYNSKVNINSELITFRVMLYIKD